MDNKYNFIENNFIIGIFLLLLYGSMTAYRRGFKPAKYFLIAHAIPLLLIMVIAVLVSFYYENQLGVFILPDIVAAIQSVTCTLALVARVDFAQAELAEQRGIAADLQRENERISLQSQIIAAQNERVKAEHALTQAEQESLENKLAFNQRELASATMYLYQKNEILLDLQKQIARLPQIATHATSVKLINNAIQSNIYLEADWENFKRHFEQVHPDFFKKLQAEHPALTANETRLCAYFHINLSVKEIAAMQNIDPASVRKARMRLNKKMNMEADKAEID
jgi:DNA-binding CsgD family transcriptional regulator